MPACLVVNPASGNGSGGRVLNVMRSVLPPGSDVVCTTGPGDATRLAARAASEGYDPVVAVGGDGTVMEVMQGLMYQRTRPTLGIVPVGSGNDIARTLSLSRDPVRATRQALGVDGSAIDVGRCNDRYFLNVGGAGLDTRVARAIQASSSRLMRSQSGYLLHGLRELRRFENPEFELTLDDRVVQTRSLLVAVANGGWFAGGMQVCPDADPADGLFDICVAGDISRNEALTLIPRIYLGRHVGHPKVQIYRASHVRIKQPEHTDVQLDGEVVERTPAEFSILPQALRVAGWDYGR